MSDMTQHRMSVIQLIDGFATEEHPGGAAQFGIQLARHLDRERYAPFVCGLWRYETASERRWLDQLRDDGIGTAVLIETPRRLATDLVRAAALLGQVIARIGAGIVNSHFERGDLLGLASKLAHPAHPAIVRTMHTDQQWQTRPWLGSLLNLVAFPWLFDGEVAISLAAQAAMDRRPAARLRGRRATLLYNGIGGALVERLASTPRCPAQPDAPRVTIVGRLAPQKGHRDFLAASAELLRRFPQAEIRVVGAGPLLGELRALADGLGIAPAVRFLGQRSDVPKILLETDLLVSASLWEGFPTVILEAMAAGAPVVATDVSGSRELVRDGETGRLAPIGRPMALAQAMIWVLERPDQAHHMAEQARRQVRRYTLEYSAAGYDQLYRHILGERQQALET
jgi:glycosyltransferase involved in cell wall biosynthesis